MMYSIMGVPPIVVPSVHFNPISVLIVWNNSYPKLAGASGTIMTLAVPPTSDGIEFPYSLYAITYA